MNNVGATLGRKLNRISGELGQSRRVALGKAGLALKNAVEESRGRVVPSGRLRNMRNARLGVRYDVRGNEQVEVKATGPWQIVERDTKAHTIQPRSRRRSGRTGVRLPDGGVRRAVRHPGTRGKHPFEKGVKQGRDKAVREVADATINAVHRGMRA